MRAIIAAAIIVAASPALAQPKLPPAPQPTEALQQRNPAARACEREYAGLDTVISEALEEVRVLQPQRIKEAVQEERMTILNACKEAGKELDWCKRIVMGDMLAQIRAECEADGEDPEVCEESALLPE